MIVIKGAIFDMDGVIYDGNGYVIESVKQFLSNYNVNLDNTYISEIISHSFEYTLDLLKSNHPQLKDITLIQFSQECSKTEKELMKNNVILKKGIEKFLINLGENGVVKGVGTASMGYRAYDILNILKVHYHFPVVVSIDDVENAKPAPDIFLEGAKRLGIEPRYFVGFEDSIVGLQAIKAAGMIAIGVKSKFVDENELIKHSDFIIEDFQNLNYNEIYKLFW
ncbi:HAD family hydrolase [Nanoarchaeota archaeon]